VGGTVEGVRSSSLLGYGMASQSAKVCRLVAVGVVDDGGRGLVLYWRFSRRYGGIGWYDCDGTSSGWALMTAEGGLVL
jgi:hypothetical protein